MRWGAHGAGCVLGVLLACGLFYLSQPRVSLVYFDKQETEGLLIRQLAEAKATPEQVARITHRFHESLQKALSDYAMQKGVVVLERHAVIAGAKDITPDVMEVVHGLMRRTS